MPYHYVKWKENLHFQFHYWYNNCDKILCIGAVSCKLWYNRENLHLQSFVVLFSLLGNIRTCSGMRLICFMGLSLHCLIIVNHDSSFYNISSRSKTISSFKQLIWIKFVWNVWTEKGDLYMWGNARDCQLGVPGLPEVQPLPVKVNFLRDNDEDLGPPRVISVAIGASHAMCLVSTQ